MDSYAIRPLAEGDFEDWRHLFEAYVGFYREELSDEVTRSTFSRLLGPDEALFGLVAVSSRHERPIGLVHCVLHPSTWSTGTTCYLEDLFVAEEARGSGSAKALIAAAEAEASRRGAERLYWHTQSFNGPARSLYDQVAKLTSFVVYEKEL